MARCGAARAATCRHGAALHGRGESSGDRSGRLADDLDAEPGQAQAQRGDAAIEIGKHHIGRHLDADAVRQPDEHLVGLVLGLLQVLQLTAKVVCLTQLLEGEVDHGEVLSAGAALGFFTVFIGASRAPLLTLHSRCAHCTFAAVCAPPFDRGVLWSSVGNIGSGHLASRSTGTPQSMQIHPSRSNIDVRSMSSCATACLRALRKYSWRRALLLASSMLVARHSAA